MSREGRMGHIMEVITDRHSMGVIRGKTGTAGMGNRRRKKRRRRGCWRRCWSRSVGRGVWSCEGALVRFWDFGFYERAAYTLDLLERIIMTYRVPKRFVDVRPNGWIAERNGVRRHESRLKILCQSRD